jgi:hypothetical protein
MIVIAEKYGQLGNRLFVFAHIIACALEHELKVANPALYQVKDPSRNLSVADFGGLCAV